MNGRQSPHSNSRTDLPRTSNANVEQPIPNPPTFEVPDGGWSAYSVVLGSWLLFTATFGYVNAFGVYQAYYISALDTPSSAISWIGSVQIWIQFSMGLLVGKLFDDGYCRALIVVGSTLFVFS
jgi:hypothetical protein